MIYMIYIYVYIHVLYCTVLYCTVLYCTVLYCTVPYRMDWNGMYPSQKGQLTCFIESVLSRLGFKERMEADAECKQAYDQATAIRWAAGEKPSIATCVCT